LLMEAGRDAISLDAIKVLRAALHTVKPMVVVGAASSLVAQRVQRGRQIIVLLMVEAAAVNILAVLKLHGESLDGVSSTVVGRDARLKVAFGVPRGRLGYAFLMVVVAGVSIRTVARELRAAHCTARGMVVGGGAFSMAAAKAQREAHLYAKHMEVGNDACSKEAAFAQKAYMGLLTTALRMEGGSAVRCLAALRVPVGELTAV
jgi:hypothetical protein